MARHGAGLDAVGDEDASGADGPMIREWASVVLSAARRRKWVAAIVFLAGASASTGYYLSLETRYRAEAKILAQRPQALPSAVRTVFEDQPARSAWELMHRRESLIALAHRAGLLADAPGTRDPSGTPAGAGAPDRPSGDEALDQVVRVLDKRLLVDVDEGTITVSVEWPDPERAYQIVQGTVENFLEARHVQEITAIDEVISVLQGRAATLRAALDDAIEESRRRPAKAASAPIVRVRGPSEELVRLQSVVEAKERAIRDVEELRVRRVAELQAQVDRARTTLSEAHPTVMGLRTDLEAASRESPQIKALRAEEQRARREYSARLAHEGFSGAPTVVPSQPWIPAPAVSTVEDDPAVKQARVQYDQITARLNAAQVELDAARAAFKYRYSVVWPPRVPTEPVSPRPRTLAAALVACVLLALGAAAVPDLWSGRISQPWQLERALALPILGEVRRRP